MTLTERLKEKLEFENNLTWDEEDALHELDRACHRGQYLENARLAPILDRLVECVEALEMYAKAECHSCMIEFNASREDFEQPDFENETALEVLTALAKELGE